MSELEGVVWMQRAATFSPCRTWRYTLERTWNDELPSILFVLLNPSTADAVHDDPTNRRGIRFAKRWGFGRCVFVNLFAWRTPKPGELSRAKYPVGWDNDRHILRQAESADRIVLAWGVHGTYMNRDERVLELLKDFQCYDMGLTKRGHPRHPLYLRADTKLWRRSIGGRTELDFERVAR